MQSRPREAVPPFRPYVFVLKEGQKIQKDLLDYSLMILYMRLSETIKSPVPLSDSNKKQQ